ncbi:MAG: hypothetical protein ABIQ04_00970 [Candidatus Saccharimonadales bacterium]
MESKNKMGLTAAIVVGGLVVGGLGGYAIGNMHSDSSSSNSSMSKTATSSTKAADLRADLVTLGVSHMIYTDKAVDQALSASKGADASGKALYDNGTTIGAAVGSVYGKDAETTFNTVWKIHLDDFVKYAVAGSKGDEAGKSAALADIDASYTKPLAQYLAKANPNLPEATLESALRDHVSMTAKMIDYRVAGDYANEAMQLDMANKHIEGLFSTLANGIVQQYPDKFQG